MIPPATQPANKSDVWSSGLIKIKDSLFLVHDRYPNLWMRLTLPKAASKTDQMSMAETIASVWGQDRRPQSSHQVNVYGRQHFVWEVADCGNAHVDALYFAGEAKAVIAGGFVVNANNWYTFPIQQCVALFHIAKPDAIMIEEANKTTLRSQEDRCCAVDLLPCTPRNVRQFANTLFPSLRSGA